MQVLFRGFLGFRRIDRVPNPRTRELCGVHERIDESVLRWFGHIERMGDDSIAKRIYTGECTGSHVVLLVECVRCRLIL